MAIAKNEQNERLVGQVFSHMRWSSEAPLRLSVPTACQMRLAATDLEPAGRGAAAG
jgi:hypothetical protein